VCVYFNNTYPDTLLWFILNCHQDIDHLTTKEEKQTRVIYPFKRSRVPDSEREHTHSNRHLDTSWVLSFSDQIVFHRNSRWL